MSLRTKTKSSLLLGASFSFLAAATAPSFSQETEAVIVTGTRVTGMTAADSAAPVTVIGSDALTKVGQPNLIQALAQITPSFSAEALGGDTGALTLSARLRGLNPNDTLVLVNGKRRHSTANLHVLSGQYQGAATSDLDLIPVASIDHIEVLQEGAAAQYGTDAIAGVVNIILKKNNGGGMASAMAGQYFEQGGDTYDFSGNIGFHHVHHLSPRVPNYRLEACHNAIPTLQAVKPMSLRESFRAVRLTLWDETNRQMISFAAARKVNAGAAAASVEEVAKAA